MRGSSVGKDENSDENSNSYTDEVATNDSPTVNSIEKNQMTWADIVKVTNKDIECEKRDVKPLIPLQ